MSQDSQADIVPVEIPAAELSGFLLQTALFHRCDAAVRDHVAQLITAFAYPAGSEVLVANSAGEAVGIVHTGRVQVRSASLEQLELLLPGESLAEVSAFPGSTFAFDAVAPEGATVLWLAAEDAQALAQRVPAFSEALGARLVQLLGKVLALKGAALAPGELDVRSQTAEHTRVGGPSIPFVELSEYDVQPSLLSLIPSKLIQKHRVVPVRLREKRLTVAMVSPRDLAAVSELRRVLAGVDIDVVAISGDDFNQALHKMRLDEPRATAKGGRAGPPATNPDHIQWESAHEEREASNPKAGEEVVRWVNKMVAAALDQQASDVHIEPTASGVRVRFRIQGTLSDWTEPTPLSCTSRAVAARIKVLANMDISERRMPQDGRVAFTLGKREVDVRVSTIPASRGEKVALRILEGAASTRPLDQIFLEPNTLSQVRRAMERPWGGILVGGPTGSGKTSTLYAILNERRLVRPDAQVLMVEDPVEYRLQGAVQVQVNPAVGLGFAQVLRAAMRQDPDVIVVGEMRDADTANLALEGAMTGHLLLSSLHANDARTVLQRLETLGSARAVISQSISLVLVQRLVRRLCNSCKIIEPPPPELLETLIMRGIVDRNHVDRLATSTGCDACNGTGAGGRVAVVEALTMTESVKTALAAGRPLEEVERMAFAENALMPFRAYGTWLLEHQLISAPEALLVME